MSDTPPITLYEKCIHGLLEEHVVQTEARTMTKEEVAYRLDEVLCPGGRERTFRQEPDSYTIYVESRDCYEAVFPTDDPNPSVWVEVSGE